MKFAEMVKNKFNTDKFIVSICIWLFGCFLSLCPIVFSYFYKIANENVKLNFFDYLLVQPELMYTCVCAVAVVSADVIQETFTNKELKSGLIVLFLLQLMVIVFGVAGYTMMSFTSGIYDFMAYISMFYLISVIFICVVTYVYINIIRH